VRDGSWADQHDFRVAGAFGVSIVNVAP
jgi:hypothetical protein